MKKFSQLIIIISLLACAACTKDNAASFSSKATKGSGGSLARFAISGNYLYLVGQSELKVYNISDATNPVLKNTTEIGFEIETIYPFNDKLFIGSTSVVHIFSVEDPEHPKKMATAISPDVLRRCDPVVAKDSVAYATLRTNGPCGGVQSILAVYDIRNITNPIQVNSYQVNEPYGLGYADTALYVCDKSTLLIFNIRKPYEPQFIGSLSDGDYFDVIPYYNTLICWVKEGIILYDISERLNPRFIVKII